MKKTLTSVKIPDDLFEEFRIRSVRDKMTLQKLTERSMFLYMTDSNFYKQIHNQLDITFPTASNSE